MTYPLKFRRHVLAVRKSEGLTYEQASVRFKVGIASLTRWNKDIKPKAYVRSKRKIDLQKLAGDVRENPDAYHYERAERFGVVASAICEALKQLGVTYKKSPETPEGGRTKTYRLPGEDQRL